MIPLNWQANTLRRLAWGTTHILHERWERDAAAKTALQQLRWGMLLMLAAPEWAQQVIREDIATHRLEGHGSGSVDELLDAWLDHMRRDWVERYPVAAFGGDAETPADREASHAPAPRL